MHSSSERDRQLNEPVAVLVLNLQNQLIELNAASWASPRMALRSALGRRYRISCSTH